MGRKRIFVRWVEEAEARRLNERLLLYSGRQYCAYLPNQQRPYAVRLAIRLFAFRPKWPPSGAKVKDSTFQTYVVNRKGYPTDRAD
jgi:hypothetical protein